MRRAILLLACACNDYPNQLVVSFDTDAPVPTSDQDTLDRPAPLFDRLRIDVYPPGSSDPCANCSNDFAVTREMFRNRQVSIGVPLQPQDGWMLRARLYLARLASVASQPNLDASIDSIVALPTAGANPGQAGMFLGVDHVGSPADPLQGATDSLGDVPSASAVGTWAGAARVPCAGTQPPGTTCIPGGAYWMGSQDGRDLEGRSGSWHRLAIVSPFYLDPSEVTVAQMRAVIGDAQHPNDPTDSTLQYCTFTSSKGPYDQLPMNCAERFEMLRYCKMQGGALPTSTQYEFVATQFGRSPYVWGWDLPTCSSAVWGNCRAGECQNSSAGPCHFPPLWNEWWGSSPPFPGAIGGPVVVPLLDSFRDVLHLSGGDVIDLAGNVDEATSDGVFSENDPLPPILQDPSWVVTKSFTVRGTGFYDSDPSALRSDATAVSDIGFTTPQRGFRCAYAAN